MNTSMRAGPTRRIGLALGSGAARGWAHIGVIEALRELDIAVDAVAGTSIGSLVGAVYASGGLETLKEVALQFDRRQLISLLDVGLPRAGLIDGRRVANEIRAQVPVARIEEFPLPFGAVATDLHTGSEVVFSKGDPIDAVRASISIPGVFTPVAVEQTMLIDGGIVNPVPVNVARALGATFVIGVDINHYIVTERSIHPEGKPPEPPEPPEAPATEPVADSSSEDPSEKSPAGRGHSMLPGFLRELKERIDSGLISQSKVLNHLRARLEQFQMPDKAGLKRWLGGDGEMTLLEVIMTSTAIMEVRIGEGRLRIEPPDLLIRPRVGHIRSHEFHRGEEAIAEGYRAAMDALGPLVADGSLGAPDAGLPPRTKALGISQDHQGPATGKRTGEG